MAKFFQKILTIGALFFLITPSYGQEMREEVGVYLLKKSPDGSSSYIDLRDLQKVGPIRRFWSVIYYGKPVDGIIHQLSSYIEIDCSSVTLSYRGSASYDKNGNSVDTDFDPSIVLNKQPIVPNSVGDVMRKMVCVL